MTIIDKINILGKKNLEKVDIHMYESIIKNTKITTLYWLRDQGISVIGRIVDNNFISDNQSILDTVNEILDKLLQDTK